MSGKLDKNSIIENHEETKDLFIDATDVALDLFLDSTTEIPFFGMASKIWKSAKAIDEYIYRKKLFDFFQGLNSTTNQSDRDAFLKRIKDKNEVKRVGQTMLLIIKNTNDLNKPIIIGKIMGAYVNRKISLECAMRLSHIIDRCYTDDLSLLIDFKEAEDLRYQERYEQLRGLGLLNTIGIGAGESGEGGYFRNIYTISRYGKILVEHGLIQ